MDRRGFYIEEREKGRELGEPGESRELKTLVLQEQREYGDVMVKGQKRGQQ